MKKTSCPVPFLLLLSFAAASLEAERLFSSDFAPENGHDSGIYAPGWDPDTHWEWSAGEYPYVIWQLDESRAVQGSNGYFKEGVRNAGGTTGNIGFTSVEFSTEGFEGQVFTVSFDFKINSDPFVNNGESRGVLQLRFRELNEAGFNFPTHELHQNLFDEGAVIGDADLGHVFDDVSVEEIGEGWRHITLTGILGADTVAANFGFQPWSFAEGADNPDHFLGSFAVDNVSVRVPSAESETGDGLRISRAVEVEFTGVIGQSYRVESSADSIQWTPVTGTIHGNNDPVRRVFSGPEASQHKYRVIKN